MDQFNKTLVGSFWQDQNGVVYTIAQYNAATQTFTLKPENPQEKTIIATWNTLNEGKLGLPVSHGFPASQWRIKREDNKVIESR